MVRVRRIVDGKVFDTATAELVVFIADVRRGSDDRKTEWTGLYKTANGRWFLAGKGGPCTRWKRLASDGDGYSGGGGLTLLSAEDAQHLLEQHHGAVEEHFDVAEG